MFTIEWFANFGFSVLRLSTPLIFAGLAAVISKKAGMMNMALEGMMLAAALGGVIFAGMTGNVWAGLAGAILLSVLVSLIIAFANLTGQTDLYRGQPCNLRRYGVCHVPDHRREVYDFRGDQGLHTSVYRDPVIKGYPADRKDRFRT